MQSWFILLNTISKQNYTSQLYFRKIAQTNKTFEGLLFVLFPWLLTFQMKLLETLNPSRFDMAIVQFCFKARKMAPVIKFKEILINSFYQKSEIVTL